MNTLKNAKPLQSKQQLENFLAEKYDPLSIGVTKINDTLKFRLIFKKSEKVLLFRFFESKYKEVQDYI